LRIGRVALRQRSSASSSFSAAASAMMAVILCASPRRKRPAVEAFEPVRGLVLDALQRRDVTADRRLDLVGEPVTAQRIRVANEASHASR
jgi:hypothetical protein